MEISIVTDDIEMGVVKSVLNGHAKMANSEITHEMWNDESKFPRKVWIFIDESEGSMPFFVVDNRTGECFVERFANLDGAMLYACDVYLTCENQASWDYAGSVKDRGNLKAYDDGYVIKCPIGIDGDGSFVFGYAKAIVEHGSTDEVFTEKMCSAIKFESREEAEDAARKILPGSFDSIKNVVPVSRERKRGDVMPCT